MRYQRLCIVVVCENEYGTCKNAASAMPIEMHEAYSMHAAVAYSMHAAVECLFTKYRIQMKVFCFSH